MQTEKIIGIGAAGLVAMGLGVTGATLASADDSPSSSSSSSTQSPDSSATTKDRKAPVDDGRELTADAASKAIAAAEAKESGAKAKGVHLGRDGGYEVKMLRSDGTMVEVVLDDGFTVTDVEERDGRGPGGHGDRRGGPGGPGEGQGPRGGSDDSRTSDDGSSTGGSASSSSSTAS